MSHQNQESDGVFQPLDESDPRTVAGYRLTAKLGSGGMGKVYLSYTPGGRPVAIKVIRPDFSEDAEFRRRFQQEVQAAQRVQGLYTAPVIDSDTDGGQPWLATAYVPGPSLAAAVGEHGPLPVPAVLLLVAGIAEALHVIHGAGIVHRDLKPSNVLLAADGPRVIDFGIARAADATSLTGSGVTVGTPAFMSPEQASGRPVTAATDLFALGLVAAYAATGSPAFGEGASHGVLYRIVHEEPELTSVPEQLMELVTRCLAKAPEDRPSVTEVIELCRTANSETQLRRPEDWLPRAVAADITGRTAAPAPDRTPPPPTVAPTAPASAPVAHPPTAPAATVTPQPPTVTAAPAPGAYGYPTPPPSAGHQQQPVPGYGYPVPTQQHPQPGGYGYPTGPTGPHTYPTAQVSPAAPARPKKRTGRLVAIGLAAALLVGLGGGLAAYSLLDGKGSEDKGKQTQADGKKKSPAASTPSDAPSDGSGEPSDDATDDGSAPLPDPEPVVYKGIDLTGGYHLSFADATDSPLDGSEGDFAYSSISSVVRTSDSMILLNPGQQGSLDTCRSETRYSTELDVDRLIKGTQICVRTDTGHLGLVVVRALPSETAASNYMTLDVTVWRNALKVDES
ncbi:protein kinase [Streptomyces sp. NPDC060035]|uniref:serine/threonine-protein kinase n=1 Tax=Streptomyces sp. NPDC060035 TaxID=3347044 RepID=UPI0036CCB8E5